MPHASVRAPRRVAAAVLLAVLAALVGAVAPRGAPAQRPTAAPDTVPTRLRERLRVPDSATIQVITLRDGSSLIGRIVAVGPDTVRFRSAAGESAIAIAMVRELREAPATALRPSGEFWFPNPNATRLLFAPTGRMLPKGTGYFSDYLIVFPGIAYGATDQFTIGGGMSLLPGSDTQLFYVTPKLGLYNREKVNIAAGALFVVVPDLGDDFGDTDPVGLVYGVGSFGTPDASVTFGLGYGFQGNRLADAPVGMIGAELRMSRRVGFVTENYIVPAFDEGPVISYALRFMGEQIALDLGFVNLVGEAIFPGVPFVGFVFNFR